MKNEAYEIKKEMLGDAEPICYGYKALNYDGGTKQNFRYGEPGENLVGKIFTIDGEIAVCERGEHFCKDPAYVFNFYGPLGYNRYFKVACYGKVIDDNDGMKSVAQTIEFVEEYDLMEYVEKIKSYDRTSHVSGSKGVNNSKGVNYSNGVNGSYGVSNSKGVNGSYGVSYSDGVSNSYGIRYCEAITHGLFCYKKDGAKYVMFNKKTTKARFDEVYAHIQSFRYVPNFDNFYELKGDKEWWSLCFPMLMEVDNKTAWSKMPQEMIDYIKSLPEYNEKIFEKIVGD